MMQSVVIGEHGSQGINRTPLVVIGLGIFLHLAGCASQPRLTSVPLNESELRCNEYIQGFDSLVAKHQSADYQAARIAGVPYLRVDRLLASLAPSAAEKEKFETWLGHLRRLDQEAREIEFANLPAAAQEKLLRATPSDSPLDTIAECSERLMKTQLARDETKNQLIERASVPDNYRLSYRVLGLYPISALIVRAAVMHWQDSVRQSFTTVAEAAQGEWRRYSPAISASDVPDHTDNDFSARDPLGVPVMDAGRLQRLFEYHAPEWEIDTRDENDKPGRPTWRNGTQPGLDTAVALVYTLPSYTRFEGKLLLQLNYILWFASRPREGALDILSGTLDGIHWRVTLRDDGSVLLYDSIHPCGCYHQFFPSPGVKDKPRRGVYHEPLLIPQIAPALSAGERLVIRVSAGAHYITQLRAVERSGGGTPYQFAPYNTLRSLPTADGGRRSLFADKGLVPGTQRAERWLLWPMGIVSPGAMRQWGHHATAFVGRRHFDDPHLLEGNFFTPSSSNR